MRSTKCYFYPILALGLALLPVVAAPREGTFERILKVTGPVDLDLGTHSGRIDVKAGSEASVRIRGIIRQNNFRGRSGDVERRIREIETNPPIVQHGNSVRVERSRTIGCAAESP